MKKLIMKKMLLSGLLGFCAAMMLAGCQSGVAIVDDAPDDPLVGWFRLVSPDSRYTPPERIIPVIRIDETYYSACRGFEVPFKATSPGRLEWDFAPSSMEGTKFICDMDAGSHYIVIEDRMRSSVSEENSESIGKLGFQLGQMTPLTRIDRPAFILDQKASPPRNNDDFVGWYMPVWFPYYKVEIRKDGDKYWSAYYYKADDGNQWQQQGKPAELAAMPDSPGLVYADGKNRNAIIYNKRLKRFELAMMDKDPALKMPLARIDQPPQTEKAPPPRKAIGIPAWH